MRLSIVQTNAAKHFYVIQSTYLDGKRSTRTVEKIGTEEELRQRYPDRDPEDVARERVEQLNQLEAENQQVVLSSFNNSRLIPKGQTRSLKGGYLFLQKIYHQLGLHKLCRRIAREHKFDFDLSDILSKLLYTRILEPGSKRSAYRESQTDIEPPSFELYDVYRALEVLAKESDRIQEHVYKSSRTLVERNDRILFYDCTNFFFEIEEADGLRQYGYSKEHKPNPLVQMGLFLDGSGFPLAFSLHPGNTNEQGTLRPLETKILKDFGLSKFIVCTDAGLSSLENRRFNDLGDRAYITTQSTKKLKQHLRDWAMDSEGWQLLGSEKTYSLSDINPEKSEEWHRVYYKSRWIHEDSLEQKLVVSFSLKYREYLRELRSRQVQRAERKLQRPSEIRKKRPTDPARFIKDVSFTRHGEVADKTFYVLDEKSIEEEACYDGFYAVCTNLEADPSEIVAIGQQRWRIEECFRTLKSEFRARPVYLQRDDRILAHFITCFLALLIFRILERNVSIAMQGNEPSTHAIREELEGHEFLPA